MATKQMKYIMLFYSALDEYSKLSDEQFGRLIRAGLRYARDGTEAELKGPEKYMFPVLQSKIDQAKQTYREKCEQNAANVRKHCKSVPLPVKLPEQREPMMPAPLRYGPYSGADTADHTDAGGADPYAQSRTLMQITERAERIEQAEKQLAKEGFAANEIYDAARKIANNKRITSFYSYMKKTILNERDRNQAKRLLPAQDFEQRSYAGEEEPIALMLRENAAARAAAIKDGPASPEWNT